jgi:hypothetical protein
MYITTATAPVPTDFGSVCFFSVEKRGQLGAAERAYEPRTKGVFRALVLSTPFFIGYEELWGSLEPIVDTRPPGVLFFAVAH